MAIFNVAVVSTCQISHRRVLNKASSSTVEHTPLNYVVRWTLACVIC